MAAERPAAAAPSRAADPGAPDPRAVRRAFGRAAATYDEAAVLQREVGARMAERLDVVKLAPDAILDAGCGTGEALAELALRYPRARRVALDLALPMLEAARTRVPRPRVAGRAAGRARARRAGGDALVRLRRHRGAAFRRRRLRPRLEQSRAAVGRRPAARAVRVPPRAEGRRPRHVHDLRARHAEGAARRVRGASTGIRTSAASSTCTTSATAWCRRASPIR